MTVGDQRFLGITKMLDSTRELPTVREQPNFPNFEGMRKNNSCEISFHTKSALRKFIEGFLLLCCLNQVNSSSSCIYLDYQSSREKERMEEKTEQTTRRVKKDR